MPMLRATLVLALAALLLASPAAQAAWTVDLVGSDGSPVGDIAIGDGDRDGSVEVYAAGWEGVQQYRFRDGAWSRAFVGGEGADSVAVGDGDRDLHGTREVYAGEDHSELAKYHWTGTGWVRSEIADFGNGPWIPTVTVGDVESDGLRELYVGVDDLFGGGDLWKVYRKGGTWHRTSIGDLDAAPRTSWIADGDRDGDVELYVGLANGQVVAVDRVDGAWRTDLVGTAGASHEWVNGVAAGDGDGDGLTEVYAAGDNASVVRFHWSSGRWNSWRIATFPAGITDLALGDADNDGDQEVLVTSWDGHLYKLERSGGSWSKQDLGAGEEESLQTLAIGNGDGAAGREVYAGSFQGAQYPFGAVYRFRA